ncbi:MAG: cytochrome c-type biogenesis protein CcmH [Sphingomonadaceae bacterium]|uniref:cytochrome c-type biogenesis protein n=1 Tax=Thermaurantiacus sp. TaxID=2820283 RepID=UPI00298EE7F7|nr:cytochrome c-type biogenesis protein [Thermaurantiacus sp.]MCS6986483.1 cytochrome c-type biogenesis protein CcmH [Sphingomonadaceae bacterium]MDW8414256.1 cytochrome c-type biogenesis protein [Thermaurantiacus sp.]
MGLRAAAWAMALGLVGAAPPPDGWGVTPLPDPRQEAAARRLMHELRCLTCQNQSIAESNAPQAETMRALVRERIRAGRSPEDVRAELIERYGDWVSFRPPPRPDTWLLWAMPVVALGLGAVVVRRLLR